jgi:hypothetical protein
MLFIITRMQATATPATMTAMAAITAAVTPVVMISANAILIGTINAKHQAMSDRLRSLTAEWRSPGTSAARQDAIRRQVRIFTQRIAWIARAHFLLYLATVCFLAMILTIALTPVIQTWSTVSVPLLLGGVFLMLIAIVLELFDLSQARLTLDLENTDVLAK